LLKRGNTPLHPSQEGNSSLWKREVRRDFKVKEIIASFKKYFNSYKIDIAIFTVFIVVGLIFANKPDLDHGLEQVTKSSAKPSGQSEVKSQQLAKTTAKQRNTYEFLEKRNIFSPDGSYEMVKKDLIQIPENPYNLIAVLKGKEKKAVFREFTGNMVSLKVGDKLIDGATITDIREMTVKVKKGREIKEYRIFDARPKR
jgi:hypothetical protein